MYRLIQVSLIITACLSSFFADAQSCKHAHKYYGQVKSASTLPSSLFRASNTRSDSVDVLRYQINLDITDFTNREIAGNCEILIRSKIDGLSNLLLDLQGFIIDSVTVGSIPLSYTYNSILLDITLPLVLNDFEEESITVYYHGQPAQDPSWGGFYWAGDYAFNMGVAFDYAPHNFGRAWFPCFDNFVERSLFVFRITTSDNKKAYCNGLLESELDNGDGTITYEWRMQDEIPTYLASVAVAPYTEISYTYEGIIDDIPVILAAVPGDTSNARTHFQNLDFCIEQFEDKYGPHRFDRIGFAMVPFSGGAMEHATSIHYPRFAITGGSLDFETLYAHELAHHWWGDNITCRTPEDMWLNEGWASWSERLFLEKVYGRAAYEASIRENHMDVIRYSHRRDGGVRRAVSGVPHEYTYGSNVYDRGADVVHTLRGYMGDEDFFGCITSFQSTYQHSDVSSLDLQNHLTDCSGKDMSHFFNDWIFTPGWTGYSVDSFYTEEMEAGQFFVRAYLRQRLGEEGVYHTEVPLPLRFIAEDGAIQEETAMLSGVCGYYDIVLPFAPKFIGVDHKELLSDAAIGETIVFASPAVYESEQALMDIEVIDVGGDSAWLRLEHHFTRADGFINPRPGLHISKERYWKISGMVGEDFLAT
ncbi:MAG: aminopeptidase N, partial [Limisphaerales bacterium]